MAELTHGRGKRRLVRRPAVGEQFPVGRGASYKRPFLILFLAALFVVTIGGGSSRTDVTSLVYVRPCLVIIVATMTMMVRWRDLLPLRLPLILTGLSLLLVLAQLVPLPPAVWAALPGHALIVELAEVQGIHQPWRPVSLTPDLTLQAALWFLSPIAALLGWAGMSDQDRRFAFLAMVALCMVGAILGGLQASSGAAYLYQRTYRGNAVGFLANRNHQGAMLALAFPLLRAATLLPTRSSRIARVRLIAAGVASLVLVPMILLTGSRTGVVLGVLGIVLAGVIAPWQEFGRIMGRWTRFAPFIMVGVLAVCGMLVMFLGRALSLSRLFGSSIESDLRVRYAPLTAELTRRYFPAGSGAGSFDTVFRIIEPDAILKPSYFNHAHNDFLEIVLTTGLLGLLLLIAGLGWWLARGGDLVRARWNTKDGRSDWTQPLALAGWSAMLILMLASIVDYPLRTPLLAFVFATAACWVATKSASFTK